MCVGLHYTFNLGSSVIICLQSLAILIDLGAVCCVK